MKELSNTQRRILTAASKAPKSDIQAHMASIKSPAVRRQVVYSMLCAGYIREDGESYYITDEGVAALKGKAAKSKELKVKAAKPAKKEKQKKEEKEKKAAAKPARTGKAKKQAAVEAQEPVETPAPQAEVEAAAPKEEAAPEADKKADRPAKGRQLLINMLSREEGATSQQMVDATGWQKGAISGTMSKIKKLLVPNNQVIVSGKDTTGATVYRIAARHEEQPVAQSA